MGRHIVKTTIEIADDLFERAQRLARKEKTSFRALTEAGLRLV
jgi:predicted transcriptional regulator